MKFTAYVIDGHPFDIRPAPVDRDWMDASRDRFAYRCLPLNIANAAGWEILCQAGFEAVWNGKDELNAIEVIPDEGTIAPAISHFGAGVLTFHVPCLFKTEPGYDLMVQGPVNRPKNAISALAGIVETDWSAFTFTMNWRFTQAWTKVRFEKGEPYCHLFPIRRDALEVVEPELRKLSEDPELARLHAYWTSSRSNFNKDLKTPGSEAQAQKWQRQYYRGLTPEGEPGAPEDHRTRLRLKPFVKGE